MIRYQLKCDKDHEFEAWFANSSAFDKQVEADQVFCPSCGSVKVGKALMAPSIVSGAKVKSADKPVAKLEPGKPEDAVKFLREFKKFVEKNSDYVGANFAEEALKIHNDEAETRSIYGEASKEEIAELNEEGVEIFPIPVLPEDRN